MRSCIRTPSIIHIVAWSGDHDEGAEDKVGKKIALLLKRQRRPPPRLPSRPPRCSDWSRLARPQTSSCPKRSPSSKTARCHRVTSTRSCACGPSRRPARMPAGLLRCPGQGSLCCVYWSTTKKACLTQPDLNPRYLGDGGLSTTAADKKRGATWTGGDKLELLRADTADAR